MTSITAVGLQLAGAQWRRVTLSRTGDIVRAELRVSGGSGVPGLQTSGAGGAAPRIVAALPANAVMSRCWQFPATDDAKLRKIIGLRLDADLPIPLDTLTWGYRRTNHRAPGDEGVGVLVQAARSERVRQLVSKLRSAGLTPNIVTSEGEALRGLYRRALQPRQESTSELLVLATGQELTAAIFENGVTPLVHRATIDPETPQAALREIQQAVSSVALQTPVRRVCWAATPEVDALGDELAQRLGVPLRRVATDATLQSADGTPLTNADLATYGTALGAALLADVDDADVLHLFAAAETTAAPRDLAGRLSARLGRTAALAAALLVLGIGLHVGALAWENHTMRGRLATVEATGSPLAALQPQITALERIYRYRIDVEDAAAALGVDVPNNIVLSSLTVSRDRRLVIKGATQNPKAIFEFADKLRGSDRFANVQPERAAPAQGGDFTISAELTRVQPLPAGGGARWR